MTRGRWLLVFYGVASRWRRPVPRGGLAATAPDPDPGGDATRDLGAADTCRGPITHGPIERVAVLESDFSLAPWVVVAVVVASFQVVERLAGMLIGVAVGNGVELLGITDPAQIQRAVLGSILDR